MSTLESLAIEPNIYYTVKEAAYLLRVPEDAVVSLVESGRVRGVRIGEECRLLGASLLDLAAEEEPESLLVADWLAASLPSLREVWDNEDDSVYDSL
jgi:excisionase family DNA binding protein